jgi:hypothetical protein
LWYKYIENKKELIRQRGAADTTVFAKIFFLPGLHNYSTIIPLFHSHSTTKNYSKIPQNGIEIIPSGDPGLECVVVLNL